MIRTRGRGLRPEVQFKRNGSVGCHLHARAASRYESQPHPLYCVGHFLYGCSAIHYERIVDFNEC